jgi:hypothetical protein
MQLMFFDFFLSELLPIFLWSFFKEPDDCFQQFICSSKTMLISIFQMDEAKEISRKELNLKVQRTSNQMISGNISQKIRSDSDDKNQRESNQIVIADHTNDGDSMLSSLLVTNIEFGRRTTMIHQHAE